MTSFGTSMYGRAYANGLPCASIGIGCVGAAFSPGTSLAGTGVSTIGQIGSPVTRLNTYAYPCLLGDAIAGITLPSLLMSTSIAADELSWSQIPWWMYW